MFQEMELDNEVGRSRFWVGEHHRILDLSYAFLALYNTNTSIGRGEGGGSTLGLHLSFIVYISRSFG